MKKPDYPGYRYSRQLLTLAICSSLGVVSQTSSARSMVLEEVIVTAQKREQSLQDVPVAVTALSQEDLEINKVINVNDLSGLAPGLTVRPAAGGTNLPSFNMRGITSYGIVSGSDKQISVYLDGVYIGNPRGSMFSLPDIQQLEILRGPQGTLFGRNATGGAVSVRTRDPNGELGITQTIGMGNLDAFSTRTTIDLPALGPLSAYVSYVTDERDGDVGNLGAGTRWDRTSFGYGVEVSPSELGSVDTDSFFLAANLDLGPLQVTYKYDHSTDESAPRAVALTGDSAGVIGITLPYSVTRPDEANNAWSTDRDQTVKGHSLVAEWDINDDWSLKNTLAYRTTDVYQPADVSGTSGFTVGSLSICLACSYSIAETEQKSNEIQLNYDGDKLTLTTGAVYFESDEWVGGYTFGPGIFPPAGLNGSYLVSNNDRNDLSNDSKSQALYAHAEYNLTETLALQAGIRNTWDEKSGHFLFYRGGLLNREERFSYKDDNTSYLLGVNYRLSQDTMAYAKWSTAFVSGGNAAGYEFEPEEVESFEIGLKSDFFSGRLRSNIAVFDATYENLQSSQSASGDVPPALLGLDPVKWAGIEGAGLIIVNGGELDARGVELELTAIPVEGLYLGASLSYLDSEFAEVSPELRAIDSIGPNDNYEPTLTAKWTGNLSMNYETQPLFGTAYLSVGLNAIWQDKVRYEQDDSPNPSPNFKPETWIVNARVALKEIYLSNRLNGEISIWGRNLLDEDYLEFPLGLGFASATTYMDPRTYGIEFRIDFQ